MHNLKIEAGLLTHKLDYLILRSMADVGVGTDKKRCMVCGYEGPEFVCPQDQMLMEEVCNECNQCMSICVCAKNEERMSS